MKEDIIKMIKILGIGCNELIFNIDLGFIIIHSIEYIEPDVVLLHHFVDDYDLELDFDEIEDEKYKKIIHDNLSVFLYN